MRGRRPRSLAALRALGQLHVTAPATVKALSGSFATAAPGMAEERARDMRFPRSDAASPGGGSAG
ncbi:hypothetical protein GCM10017786_58140 [Amycolatopsis deserti]|uniref:Uncharacterized protein n=1 Tax=Amycolatopsis deserti TaxID=185696 RepID=A0ABQ3JC10_9PSEU|nr:hypothetical protein GCM10017786_58140 [Amycolatopsis deserti]